jgi:hypothetical protein
MFFSCATRPTKSATGRPSGDAVPGAESLRRSPPANASERNAGGQDMDRHGDAVAFRRCCIAVDGTMTASSALHWRREKRAPGPQPAAGQEGRVVLQVFLEQRVIGGQHRQAERAGRAQAGVVRDERGLDVDQVAIAAPLQARPDAWRASRPGGPPDHRHRPPGTRTMPGSSGSSP